MPEFAEVEFFRRRWEPGMGHAVVTVDCHPLARVFRGCDPVALARSLRGAVLNDSRAHGKQMLFGFSGGGWLGIHLGMTGALALEGESHPAGRHDHLVLRQAGQSLVFADSRMFGRLRFDMSPGSPPGWWQNLPPDLLGPDFTVAWLLPRWQRRARSPLKAVLLDQSLFPGIGNWMADEILWRLQLHPLTPAGSLAPSDLRDLRRVARSTARGALATIGVDWSDPPISWLYQHRWAAGQRCPRPRCRSLLLRRDAAGRTTCWCPACQPECLQGRSLSSAQAIRTGHRRASPTRPNSSSPGPR